MTLDSQDSPLPRLEGSHHLPSYSILCTSPWELHPNDFLSRDSQMGFGSPEIAKVELSQLCKTITSCVDFQLGWGLNWSCSPRRELSNDMLHVTCTQGNQVDFWLSMVESQLPIWLFAFLLNITCVTDIQMVHSSPFWTSKSQYLSNGINNSSRQGVLTLAIAL